ncbi:MAG: phosphate ABC transporter permease subunit PstC [Bacteroidetes bacterium]|nr:phosphate ABC transporter permease subunit PstC [Bacteroidota bacterium]
MQVNRFLKNLKEKIIEGILTLSGTITSIAVILIIIFLFKEGIGVFNQAPMEKELILAVNKDNHVKELTPRQIKDIFDGKIAMWSELGGSKDSIKLFRTEDVSTYFTEEELGANFEHLPQKINEYIAREKNVLAFFNKKYITKGFSGRIIPLKKIGVMDFLLDNEWFPTAQPVAQLGVLPLILGTLWVTLLAILLALPLGLATAIYMAEIASPKIRSILKPTIELLAGIPSVVYGFFGLVVLVPFIQRVFNVPVGETGLAGSIVLAIMALPTIITISEDSLRTAPRQLKEASLALGASHWQTIWRVIVPYSSSGITAAIILGVGRAIGETMAVLMVTGNAAVIPHSYLAPLRTIPATIAAELGEASYGGLHFKALFALGCILFIMTFIINLIFEFIVKPKKH